MNKIVKLIGTTLSDLGTGNLLQPHIDNNYHLEPEENIDYDSSGNLFSHYVLVEGRYIQDIESTQIAAYLANVAQAEQLVKAHVQLPISNYNKLTGTNFESVYNCTTYTQVMTYPHQKMCVEAVEYNALVWNTSRQIQIDILEGNIEQPTTPEEFIALLPETPTFTNT